MNACILVYHVMSLSLLAKEYNVSRSTVKRSLRRKGFDTSKNKNDNTRKQRSDYTNRKTDQELKSELENRYVNSNEAISTIAESWGISIPALSNYIGKFDLPRRYKNSKNDLSSK